MALITGVVKCRPRRIPERLMIRDVGNRGLVGGDAISNGRRSVIKVLRFDQDVANAEESFFKLRIVDAARQILKLHREIGVLHLPGKRILKTTLECRRSVDVQLCSGKECGSEKGETLNVVPVRMANQEMNPMGTRPAQHIETKDTNSCAAIEDEICTIIGTNFDTRSVA